MLKGPTDSAPCYPVTAESTLPECTYDWGSVCRVGLQAAAGLIGREGDCLRALGSLPLFRNEQEHAAEVSLLYALHAYWV